MRYPAARRLFARFLPLVVLLFVPALGRGANSIDVKFETFDRVQLHGTFYPAQGGTKSPCVILVHKLGGNRQQAGWDDLINALQKQDYAVLAFDLRGHGESVAVDPQTFWRSPSNVAYIKGASARKDKISYKEFSRDYTPVLANDLAAAKKFLNEQNNARLCNSSNIMVVGEEEGAAIGALWIASEWLRPRVQRDIYGRILGTPTIGGMDLAAAAWLSMPPTLSRVSMANWFRGYIALPGGTRSTIGERTPMAFFYGKGDSSAASAARAFLGALSPRNKQTLSTARPKDGKAVGIDLVAQGMVKPDEDIAAFFSAVQEKRSGGEWSHKESPDLLPISLTAFGYYNLR